jgi:hypothetical protein
MQGWPTWPLPKSRSNPSNRRLSLLIERADTSCVVVVTDNAPGEIITTMVRFCCVHSGNRILFTDG